MSSPRGRRTTTPPPDLSVSGTWPRCWSIGPLIFRRGWSCIYNQRDKGDENDEVPHTIVLIFGVQKRPDWNSNCGTRGGLLILPAVLAALLHWICSCSFPVFILIWNKECPIRVRKTRQKQNNTEKGTLSPLCKLATSLLQFLVIWQPQLRHSNTSHLSVCGPDSKWAGTSQHIHWKDI